MNTWTCQCGEMNAGSLGWCRCGMAREPLLSTNQLSGKTGILANHSESPKSSRKAMTPEERLNKTERSFLEYLKYRWDKIGIQSITLRLAWGVRYTPDFWTKSNTTLHFWEVKGFMRDDARKSLMFAAKEYPWAIFWLVKRDKSQPNGWLITEVQR